jgi:hypothetical protein
MEILKARRSWNKVFLALNKNNSNTRILYQEKLSLKINGAIKVFHDKQKLKQYMTTKSSLQKILKEILHKQNHERANNTKAQEKKRQKSRE